MGIAAALEAKKVEVQEEGYEEPTEGQKAELVVQKAEAQKKKIEKLITSIILETELKLCDKML
jgi:hypothetical protein